MNTQVQPSTRHRSPAYPAFSLKAAVDKIGQIYQAHKRNSADSDALKRTMGYEMTTSHAMRALSALIQFGLIEEEGNASARRLKLSDLGLNIVLRSETDAGRAELLQTAAANPVIYGQMLEMWKEGLPPEEAISNYLLFTKNFNPAAVPGVIRDFKATYEFAQFAKTVGPIESIARKNTERFAGSAVRSETKATGPAETATRTPGNVSSPATQSDLRRYQLPLPKGRQAAIEVPSDATGADIDFLVKYLWLIREAVTAGTERERDAADNDSGKIG